MNTKLLFLFVLLVCSSLGYAKIVGDIRIEGNRKVESDAILGLLTTAKGSELDRSTLRDDLKKLYELEYFSELEVFSEELGDRVNLRLKVAEKPAVTSISFQGMDEFKEDDFKDLETKVYTIVSEGKLAKDIRTIERKYSEKGFYLAKAVYELTPQGANDVSVTFRVKEYGKVLIGDVFLLGNKYYSTSELLSKMASQPYTRASSFGSSSIFQEEMVQRDGEFLNYYYRDAGFADVKVSKPVVTMDPDKRYMRITHSIEEGVQYHVGSLKVSGDVGADYFEEEELLKLMQLKEKELFRYSRFSKDVEMLIDKYGDLGYAYVDVNPITNFDKEKQTVDLDYKITKGIKVYFGEMNIVGNTKTRDNVIRREFEIADSELYSGTKMAKSKENISRLGFFEDVQLIKERDHEKEDLVNLKVKVKEKSTGMLNASLGYSPGEDTAKTWFGQGRYDEKNQSGRAWDLGFGFKYADVEDFQVDFNLADPKINDSPWSAGVDGYYRMQRSRYAVGVDVLEERKNLGLSVGRKLVELIRGSVSLKNLVITPKEKVYLFEGLVPGGVQRSLGFALSRKDLNNYIDPNQGSNLIARQQFTGGLLGGDFQFMESSLEGTFYIPVDFAETYRTYFKLFAGISRLWRFNGADIPQVERYRLGGFNDLRGFGFQSLGPKEKRLRSPYSGMYDYNKGGNKQLYFQSEYFVPLIPQAGIKGLLFADFGRVFQEEDPYSFRDMNLDMGFGFRWITPIAPFRFEWAYPYDPEKKALGDFQFIFTLGN